MSETIIGQTLLKQFRVDAFIASGGMGAVYRVWDLKRNVPLAMKVLHSDLAEDPSVLKRFQREARALQKLTHPNIVPFYGLNQTSDFFFLLEKYIDGPTLKDIFKNKRGPLPLEEALTYFTALCSALGFAHHNGVVHCDIKPGNIMMDRGGNIYLTDFGIARHAESTVTTFGGAGTPAYMAPEQILDKAVSPATDVYALGIILYEMLTGVRPFRGDEPGLTNKGGTSGERIRYAQLNLSAPDPRQINSSIPVELADIITKAMAKSHVERYQNATEMLNAVQGAFQAKNGNLAPQTEASDYAQPTSSTITQGVPDKSIRIPGPGLSGATNNKTVIIAGLAILLVIFGAFAISRIGNASSQSDAAAQTEQAAADIAVQVATGVPPTKRPSLPTETSVPQAPPDASSNWIAYTYGVDQDSTGTDPRYLERINIQTGEKQRLTFDNGGINFPSFSSTGDQIVYTGCKSGFCQLYILDIGSGNIEKLPGITVKAMWPSWCSDGDKDLIAFEGRVTSSNRRIYLYDGSTKKVSPISKGSYDLRPSWSPDCSKIVFLRDIKGQDDIYIHDVQEDRDYAVLESTYDEFNASWSPDGKHIIFTRVTQDTNGDGFQTLDDYSDLFMMNADGSDITALTNSQYGVFSPSFSPDGKQIVFVAFTGSQQNQQIIVYSLDDASFKTIASNGPYNHVDWSP